MGTLQGISKISHDYAEEWVTGTRFKTRAEAGAALLADAAEKEAMEAANKVFISTATHAPETDQSVSTPLSSETNTGLKARSGFFILEVHFVKDSRFNPFKTKSRPRSAAEINNNACKVNNIVTCTGRRGEEKEGTQKLHRIRHGLPDEQVEGLGFRLCLFTLMCCCAHVVAARFW